MNRRIIFCAGLLTTLALPSAYAGMPNSSGFYAEGNLGYGKVAEEPKGATKDNNSGLGLNISGGYKFNNNLGLEVGLSRYPDEDFGTANGDTNYAGILTTRLIFPFDNGFNVFGKLGIAHVNHYFSGKNGHTYGDEGTQTATTGYMGVGVGYTFTPNWEGVVQMNSTTSTGAVPAMQMITVGAMYMF